jgi:hypothetical protein
MESRGGWRVEDLFEARRELSMLRQQLAERDVELAEFRAASDSGAIAWCAEFKRKLAERDAAIAELKQRLAATEDFTRQCADRVMAQNEKPDPVTPRADQYRALLTVAEPTHLLGGDKAR